MKKFIEIIKKLYTKNKVVFFISSFVVLVALGLLVWYFILNPIIVPNENTKKQQIEEQLSAIRNDSNLYYDNDSYKQYAKKIDSFIAENKPEKNVLLDIYKIKATTAINSFNFEDCYTTALKIDEISPSYDNTELIGDCLAGLDRKQEAIKSYEKSISMIIGDTVLDQLSKSSISNKITNLSENLSP